MGQVSNGYTVLDIITHVMVQELSYGVDLKTPFSRFQIRYEKDNLLKNRYHTGRCTVKLIFSRTNVSLHSISLNKSRMNHEPIATRPQNTYGDRCSIKARVFTLKNTPDSRNHYEQTPLARYLKDLLNIQVLLSS